MNEVPHTPVGETGFNLKNIASSYQGKELDKESGKKLLKDKRDELRDLQERFYADGKWSLLIILQGMDASGKDSAVKRIFTGINPQGCHVTSFKAPTDEDLKHDYLWRCIRQLPEQGKIGIFNRSYYEEVLVVKVYQHILEAQNLPPEHMGKQIWDNRYTDINNFEAYLSRNGTRILKFYLHISPEEQKERLLARTVDPDKYWKVGKHDLQINKDYKKFEQEVNEMIIKTSTDVAPWHIVPADDKWYAHLLMMNAIIQEITKINPQFPEPTEEQLEAIKEAKKLH